MNNNNKATNKPSVPWLGLALMGIGQGLTGENFLGVWQRAQELEAEREMREWQRQLQQQQLELEKQRLSLESPLWQTKTLLGDMEAKMQLWKYNQFLRIWDKYQKGEKLEPWEEYFISGYKPSSGLSEFLTSYFLGGMNLPSFPSERINLTQSIINTNKIKEGTIAVNKKTGEKLQYKGGKWIPIGKK